MDTDRKLRVYSIFDELSPAAKERLENTDAYQRFIFERAILEMLAARSLSETGRVNDPDVMKQERIVNELADAVLEEIRII